MYVEKMVELNEVREDLGLLKECLGGLNEVRYPLAYQNILKLAHKLDGLSECHYSSIVTRIERAHYCLSLKTLNACLDYIEVFIKLTDEYLQLSAVNEFLNQEDAA